MKISITHELTVFLIMTALGIFDGILFDVFRVWRKMLSKSFLAVGISDAVCWILAGSAFAFTVWNFADGELRGYIFIGIILGLVLYFLTFSDRNISIITGIFIFFLKIFKFFLKILLTPGRFLYKMILEPVQGFIKRKIYCILKVFNIRNLGIKNDKKTK